jgi:hypothetical protein
MVAVVTELMVGGERSTQDDSIKRDPLGLWSLSSDSERCFKQRQGHICP